MRVMADSNIIISALVFKSSNMSRVIREICDIHELCIASCTVSEVRNLMELKFSDSQVVLDEFFDNLTFTLIHTPEIAGEPLFKIRDINDYEILLRRLLVKLMYL